MKYGYEAQEPITGELLKKRLSEKIVHEIIADSFIHKGSTVMITSHPGVGKSAIGIQEMLQLASGQPLFNALQVPRPMKVWFLQMERSETESLERMQFMADHIPIMHENLFLDTELQAHNFLNEKDFEFIIERGLKIKPDIIYIDPLYGLAPNLSDGESGQNLSKRLTIMKKVLDTSLRINHHNTKDMYFKGKKVEKDDPFYGAVWLKAHVTALYNLKKTSNGTVLELKKSSHTNVLEKIELSFDKDTFISSMESDQLDAESKYKLFINSKIMSGNKPWLFNEARDFIGCVDSRLRQLNRTPLFKECLITHKFNGKPTLYTVKFQI